MGAQPQQLNDWVSPFRFRPYLVAANHDHATAVELYQWNATASAAYLAVFHYLEVILRNAVDRVMTTLEIAPTARKSPDAGWWFGDSTILTEGGINAFRTSREQVRPEPERLKRDKVLANLTFGFWQGLFSKDYDNLFRHHLVGCFPFHPQEGFDRKEVSSRLDELRKLRNRVAHHEPIHHLNLEELHEQAFDLLTWIDPAAAAWVRSNTHVPEVLARRPGPAEALAVVVPAAAAWPLYQTAAAYVCQPGRSFQRVSHVAFYADGEIKQEIPKVLDRLDHVEWTPQKIGRLRATKDPRDARLAEVIRESRALGWREPEYQVFLLSTAHDTPPVDGHVTLTRAIPHGHKGRGSAFVQRQRYAPTEVLRTVTSTADIPVWR